MYSNKIKIFFFIDRFRIGGMHRQVLYLVRHLNRDIFEPIVISQSQHGGLFTEYQETGCKLIDLKWKGRGSLAILFRLIKHLRREKPDIIFIAQPPNFIYFRLARIFWRKPVKQIGSFRALTFWRGHERKVFQYLDNFLASWLVFTSDYVVVNSNALINHYSNLLKVQSKCGYRTILNGSDFNFPVIKGSEELRNELNISLDETIVVMIARLDPWKDFNTFIEAANIVVAKNGKVKFLIVGEGVLRRTIEEQILKYNLIENVLLIGERQDVFNFINLADIIALSTHGEGFSNSILEAMSFGKPVIATDVGGNTELIGLKNEFGMLIPPKSPVLFAEAILKLSNNVSLRNNIGIAAKERIYQLCSINNFLSSYEELFMEAKTKI